MLESLKIIDTYLFLFLNGAHISWLDYPMWLISGHLPWIPVYLMIIYLILKKYDKKALLIIPLLILAFICTDLISDLIKHSIQRYRPTHNLILQNMVHTVSNYRGGTYGFVSSHAANTFCVAILSIMVLRIKYLWFILLWPIAVSYSRIYLGVHYPSDIVGGACLGLIMATLFYIIFKILIKKIFPIRHDKFFYQNSKRP